MSFPVHHRRVVLSLLLLASLPAQAAWDALAVSDRFYPNTHWESRFSVQPDVVATDSVDEAIYRCDDVVGVNRYCVVEIADSAVREPVFLTRSRTKLVGAEGMAPLTTTNHEAVITVESDTRQVVIENLEIAGHNARWEDTYGILVSGENINGVVIRDNHIYGIVSWYNAHGIAVYGSGSSSAKGVRNILVENNNLHDLKTGSSESIAMNGNVFRWAVIGNTVKDVNNIAIDAIGGEGTAPTRTLASGRVVPGARDRARYGFILNNHVENMSTLDNPAYNSERSWAAGIYVDGGLRIKVAGNTVLNTPWAYEVGAENCLVTAHITLEDNRADNSWYGDLLLGGYSEVGYNRDSDINCDPLASVDAEEGHGYVSRIRTQDNQFNSSGNRMDKILPQYRLRGAVILDPGVDAVNTHRNGGAPGDENAILTQEP